MGFIGNLNRADIGILRNEWLEYRGLAILRFHKSKRRLKKLFCFSDDVWYGTNLG
ncbi:hypothetical protein [Neisseria sicca]|uniref:hypothetical protein n=1 Tax=Neisseria sicca TaxID=490 RepID=UPI001649893B|nr:hypothetical protein [Neisseria sicca]